MNRFEKKTAESSFSVHALQREWRESRIVEISKYGLTRASGLNPRATLPQSADKNLSDLAGRVFPVVRKLKFLEFGLVPEGRAGMMSAFEMNERETILLDARLESVIEPHAFRAVLGNGHGFTAFVAVRDREKDLPAVNECVKVEMSPANMSTGRILL